MREFFKGWRRKVGCVALVMACVMTVGWLCSSALHEFLYLKLFDRHYQLNSESGRITLLAGIIDTEMMPEGATSLAFDWHSWALSPENRNPGNLRKAVLFYNKQELAARYWVIALPLTLLSAYLILWKSRTKTSTTRPG